VLTAVLPGHLRPSMPKGNALLAYRETLSSPLVSTPMNYYISSSNCA
jgi:hypothetical protein